MVREAQPVGDRARVADVLPGAARPDTLRLGAMIIELQRHPDHLGARARRERRDDARIDTARHGDDDSPVLQRRSEEHTSELQSLMRISYAVFCLKTKKI